MGWRTSLILALKRLWREDHKFKACIGHRGSSRLLVWQKVRPASQNKIKSNHIRRANLTNKVSMLSCFARLGLHCLCAGFSATFSECLSPCGKHKLLRWIADLERKPSPSTGKRKTAQAFDAWFKPGLRRRQGWTDALYRIYPRVAEHWPQRSPSSPLLIWTN